MIVPKEYYPTPAALAGRMIGEIDLDYICSILEPSAGTGELADEICKAHKEKYWRRSERIDIDCIEIEPELRSVLKGKEYRVVHDDFLTFQTFKRYDAIIMNPPFSNGDKHLLKALELQKNGGKVVCLLNAETLRNQCSNVRKDLWNKLQELDADIEYLQGEFLIAERKTKVEVALVYVDIPRNNRSDIFENLKKAKEQNSAETAEDPEKLAKGDIIDSLIDQFNFEVAAGTKLIDEYNALAPQMLDKFKKGSEILKLQIEGQRASVNDFLQKERYKYWSTFFSSDKIMKLCTEAMQRDYMEQLESLRDYDFNKSNILQIMIDINNHLVQSVESTILALFDQLSYQSSMDKASNIHYYNGWKTNKAFIINKKVIIPLHTYDSQWFKKFNYDYQVKRKLMDIEKVFNYLDDGTTEGPDLMRTLESAEKEQVSRNIHLKYFYVTFYKKGTCHIEFTNERLLKKFNIFGSQHKGWLPPSYGKKRYKDMDMASQKIVDEFEGEKQYEEVFNEPEYYLAPVTNMLMLTGGAK